MTIKRHILAAAAIATLAATSLATVPASAEERICRGTLGKVTVDNLKVPSGASCRLDGTRIKGNIVVENRGTLVANRIVVVGSVQAEGARQVTVQAQSRIGGDVQVKQGGGATLANSFVDGSVQLESNKGALAVIRSTIDSDVQAFQNTGGVRIQGNVIDGNLQCKENRPAPVGGANKVDGSKEDQCSRL